MGTSRERSPRANRAAVRFSSGTADIGSPKATRTPEEALASGDFKFMLQGQRLHGSWVLVRMKHDRTGGKRTNWLLVKHRDEHAREGDTSAVLAEDRSIASGRPMAAIAAGTGRGPKAFMLGGIAAVKADAVWDSRTDHAAENHKERKAGSAKTKSRTSKVRPHSNAALPDFIAPQLCEPVERPPSGDGWGHEIKFDGYRIQLRVQNEHVIPFPVD